MEYITRHAADLWHYQPVGGGGQLGNSLEEGVGTRLRNTGPDQRAGCGLLAQQAPGAPALAWAAPASCTRSPKTARHVSSERHRH